MRGPLRGICARTSPTNRPDCIEKLLRFGVAAGISGQRRHDRPGFTLDLVRNLIPNHSLGFRAYAIPTRGNPVNAIAGSQRTRACIDKVISTNACSVPLSQPPLNFFNSVSFKDPYSFCASHRRILAGKDATGDPPENQLWMGLEKARWRGRVIQFPQFIPNAKQLHGDSATDSLAPIVKVSFIKRLEIPDAAPRAEKNARSDQRSGFDIALPVSP